MVSPYLFYPIDQCDAPDLHATRPQTRSTKRMKIDTGTNVDLTSDSKNEDATQETVLNSKLVDLVYPIWPSRRDTLNAEGKGKGLNRQGKVGLVHEKGGKSKVESRNPALD
jgi:hypothetical protein